MLILLLLAFKHPTLLDHLLYLVYERIPVKEGSLNPHLWTYRSRITLEHLSHTLQQQGMRKRYPILYHFLQEVSVYCTFYPTLIIHTVETLHMLHLQALICVIMKPDVQTVVGEWQPKGTPCLQHPILDLTAPSRPN